MALCSAALVPHSPLLAPNIGKENTSFFTATIKAMQNLSQEIKEADTIIVITPHGLRIDDQAVWNISPEFKADLSDFGDLVTDWRFNGDVSLPARFREKAEDSFLTKLLTQKGLDYASSIPLYLLNIAGTNIRVSPFSPPKRGLFEDYLKLGMVLRDLVLDENKNIALIASADLSHRLSKKSPAGYSSKAAKLDQKIIKALMEKNEETLRKITDKNLTEAGFEDYDVLLVFFGFIKETGYNLETLSYEFPFGTGHTVLKLKLDHEEKD